MSEHAFLHVICRHEMKTVRRPSDREVNWRSPVQGKSHHVQVKEPYGNSNWLLIAFILQLGVYNTHRLCPPRKFRRNGRKKERKAVFYAIAHKSMLFLIFRNMIWIVLKYCFC